MINTPFFDPEKTYYENMEAGPAGAFQDDEVYEYQNEPSYDFCGHKIHVPIGIPAGPLPDGAYVRAALDKGFTLPVHKTIRTHYLESHQWPNIVPVDVVGDLALEQADKGLVTKDAYEEPLSITNSFGNPSFAPDVWQPDLAKAVQHARAGQVVGGSFEGRKWDDAYTEDDFIQDWVAGAKLLQETGVGFVEANFSCPNEGTTALLCYDIPKVQTICSAVKDAIGDLPLFIKTPFFNDNDQLSALVEAVGGVADGFASINTISAEVRTPDGAQALPGEGRLRSGICGTSIKWAGIEMVTRLKTLREDKNLNYTIIGVGGIMKAEDFSEYQKAGADVAMSATGAMWDPHLAIAIDELSQNR